MPEYTKHQIRAVPTILPVPHLTLPCLNRLIDLVGQAADKRNSCLVVFPDGRLPVLASTYLQATIISALYITKDLPARAVTLSPKKGR